MDNGNKRNEKVTVGTKVSERKKKKLEQEAIERSEPGNRVTVGQILRELIDEHVDLDGFEPPSEDDGSAEMEA